MLRSGGFRAGSYKYSAPRDQDGGVGRSVLSEAHVSVRSMLTSLPIWVCVLWLLNSARRYQFPHSGSSLTLVTLNAGTMMSRRRFEPRPDVLATLRASGLLRICVGPFSHLTDSSLRSSLLFGGRNGPAQVRTTSISAGLSVVSRAIRLTVLFRCHIRSPSGRCTDAAGVPSAPAATPGRSAVRSRRARR